MNRKFRSMCIVMGLITSSFFVAAQVAPRSGAPSSVSIAPQFFPEQKKIIADPDSELVSLRIQNKLIKEFQDNLLNTVFLALTVVATVAALLVGYSGWVNFKFYADDKVNLLAEVDRRFKNQQTELESRSVAHQSKLAADLATAQNEISREISKSLISLSEKLLESDVKTGEAIAAAKADAKDQVDRVRESVLVTANSTVKLAKGIAAVEATLREVEEHIWQLKNIPINVLVTQNQGLRAALDSEVDWRVVAVLNRMVETIQSTLLNPPKPITAEIIKSLKDGVSDASQSQPVLSAKVLELLDRIPTRE